MICIHRIVKRFERAEIDDGDPSFIKYIQDYLADNTDFRPDCVTAENFYDKYMGIGELSEAIATALDYYIFDSEEDIKYEVYDGYVDETEIEVISNGSC